MPRQSSQCAFTLIELLVVIGIIAVLVSILLPSLQKARLEAQVVNCMSNQRQVIMALKMYAADNKQTGFPWLHETQIYSQFSWIQGLIDGKYLNRATAKCTAEPLFCFGTYRAMWDPSNFTPQGVPSDGVMDGWYFYLGRARAPAAGMFPRVGSTGGVNGPIQWGLWSPHWITGVRSGLNWGQFESTYVRAVAASNVRDYRPLTSCPYNAAYGMVTTTLPAYFPQGPGWAQLPAHRRFTAVNFGNADGSVLTLNVKMQTPTNPVNQVPLESEWAQLIRSTWPTR